MKIQASQLFMPSLKRNVMEYFHHVKSVGLQGPVPRISNIYAYIYFFSSKACHLQYFIMVKGNTFFFFFFHLMPFPHFIEAFPYLIQINYKFNDISTLIVT